MTKNNKLKPDTILKNYWSGNDEFADLFNAVLFGGRQIIKPEELSELNSENSLLEFDKDKNNKTHIKTVTSSRDVIKIQKHSSALGINLAMLGLENQEHVHYAMPMRVMGYDYFSYKQQYEKISKAHKSSDFSTEDEFLSKMKQSDKLIPVITVVIYYGENPWNGAKTLHEMLDIPPEMLEYINNYKMHLIEARQSNLNFKNSNNCDLFNMLKIILDTSLNKKEAIEKTIKYSEEHNTKEEVIMTVASAANLEYKHKYFENGGGNMCTLFKEIAREAREEGMLEGMNTGRIEGLNAGRIEGLNAGRLEGLKTGKIQGIIETLRDLNVPDADITKKLKEKFKLTDEEAENYLM